MLGRRPFTLLVACALSVPALAAVAAGSGAPAAATTFCDTSDVTIVNTLRTDVDVYLGGALAFRSLAPGASVGSFAFAATNAQCTITQRVQFFRATTNPKEIAPFRGALLDRMFTEQAGAHMDLVGHVATDGRTHVSLVPSFTARLAPHRGVLAIRHAANAPAVDVRVDGRVVAPSVTSGRGVTLQRAPGRVTVSITEAGSSNAVAPAQRVRVRDGVLTSLYVTSRRDGSRVATVSGTTQLGSGYRLVTADGGVFAFGSATFRGSAGAYPLVSPVVAGASTPSGDGYWLAAADGGVFAFGDARFHGAASGLALKAPVVAFAPTPSGGGYWLATADGGVFAFGDARFLGSAVGSLGPGGAAIVDLEATGDGFGYYLLSSSGAVYAFGDAHHHGNAAQAGTSAAALGVPASNRDYWVLFANGGRTELNARRAWLFGNPFPTLGAPMVSMRVTATAQGAWTASSDGGVFALGNASYRGNLVGVPHRAPVVAVL